MQKFLNAAATALEDPRAPWALLALALSVRVLAALLFGDISEGAWRWEYGKQAECAAAFARDLCLLDPDGTPYASALMPPLTSYLWVMLFHFLGVGSAANAAYVALNIIVGAAAAPLLYHLARTIGVERAPASIAGAIIALYPTFVFVSIGYHATNFTVALMLGFAVLYLHAARSLKINDAIVAGLVGGLAAMTRNEFLLLNAAATLLLLWLGRAHFQAALRASVALAFGVGLVLSPWIVRNYVTFDHFIPGGSQAGYNVWIGFGPQARGSGNAYDADPVVDTLVHDIREHVRRGDAPGDRYELRLQDAFLADAQPSLREGGAPRVAWLMVKRFVFLWLFDWTDPLTHNVGYWGAWLITQALAVFGVFALWRKRSPPLTIDGALLIGLSLGIMTLAYLISSIFARYRMHMEPYIFVFAALGAWALIGRWRKTAPP
jgi:hypothetical protein